MLCLLDSVSLTLVPDFTTTWEAMKEQRYRKLELRQWPTLQKTKAVPHWAEAMQTDALLMITEVRGHFPQQRPPFTSEEAPNTEPQETYAMTLWKHVASYELQSRMQFFTDSYEFQLLKHITASYNLQSMMQFFMGSYKFRLLMQFFMDSYKFRSLMQFFTRSYKLPSLKQSFMASYAFQSLLQFFTGSYEF